MFQTTFNPETLQWNGPERFEPNKPSDTIGEALLKSLDGPSRIIQISANNDIELSNKEIRQKSIRVAQNLLKLGITKNDVLGFCTKNSHYLAPVVFGSMFIGAPVNPLDPSYEKYEIVHLFKYTKPSMVFVDSENIEKVREALQDVNLNVPIFVFGDPKNCQSVEELFVEVGLEDEFKPVIIGNAMEHTAAIICSSGTTGLSKGVSLSNSSILNNLFATMSQNDVILSFSSLYWFSGFIALITGTLSQSKRIITTDQFNPDLMLRLIEKYKVTHTITAPTSLSLVLKSSQLFHADISSLQLWLCGGSHVPNEHIEQLQKYLPYGQIIITYGFTEICGSVSLGVPSVKPHTVGQLVAGVTVKIVDDNGNRVGVGIDGEICVQSKHKFLGYYQNKEGTDLMTDAEGFLKSGDIGHFDEFGDLFCVDRKKDIFKYKSTHISPTEIENVILKLDGVKLVTVIGIPDVECMELPAAVVVKTDGSRNNVTNSEINEIVKNNLSDANRLRGGIYFFNSLPMTPSGKILRRQVREIVMALHAKSQTLKSSM